MADWTEAAGPLAEEICADTPRQNIYTLSSYISGFRADGWVDTDLEGLAGEDRQMRSGEGWDVPYNIWIQKRGPEFVKTSNAWPENVAGNSRGPRQSLSRKQSMDAAGWCWDSWTSWTRGSVAQLMIQYVSSRTKTWDWSKNYYEELFEMTLWTLTCTLMQPLQFSRIRSMISFTLKNSGERLLSFRKGHWWGRTQSPRSVQYTPRFSLLCLVQHLEIGLCVWQESGNTKCITIQGLRFILLC